MFRELAEIVYFFFVSLQMGKKYCIIKSLGEKNVRV